MKHRVDELLAGPRGRRLCLYLASMYNPLVQRMVSLLAYELDPGKGVSRVWLGPRGDDGAAVSIDQLATLLTGMDLSCIIDEDICEGLVKAVDSAMGWQQPDGDDVLARHPSIRTALRPVAEHVMASPLTKQWEPPRQEVQWVIEFDWESIGGSSIVERDDPPTALAAWAQDGREEEVRFAAQRVANPDTSSTSGGWWSTPHGVIATVGQIPAGLDLIEDGFGWKRATVIPVRGDGRTYEVHAADDWVRLCRDYPLDVTASRRYDWRQVTGRTGRWVIPNWEQVAAHWDAVHLTVLGYLSSATRALTVDADTATVIAGWGPDTTVWLTDTVRECDLPRQEWERQYHDAWTRV